LLPPSGPSRRVSGVSPYKPHHERVELEGLSPDLLLRSDSRNFKEVGHPSDGPSSIYGRHRIAVVDFNFASIHFVAHLRLVGFGEVGGSGRLRHEEINEQRGGYSEDQETGCGNDYCLTHSRQALAPPILIGLARRWPQSSDGRALDTFV
jgi:hypothetical protein